MTVFVTRKKMMLASASPRRRKLLNDLGITFEIHPARIREQRHAGELPEAYARRLAQEKTQLIADQYQEAWVLGADTIVVLEDRILGKPEDRKDAQRLLMLLAGKEHEVLTGFCLACVQESRQTVGLVSTRVTFSRFPAEIVAAYIRTGEPLDKAGAYGIQGRGGFLVKEIAGSYSNVIGLPLAEVVGEMLRFGIIETAAGG
jgi:septum formation protein